MRGKPYYNHTGRPEYGNIPAYAGKTALRSGGEHDAGEHPRVCGENFDQFYEACIGEGTSPRMRGKQCDEKALG